MEQQFNQEVLQKLKRKKRQNIWRRILSVMMCIVVFCTTYMLILPAITKQTDTFCGIEEHIHQESCYEDTLLCLDHVHGDLCYTLAENLICTEPAEPMHIHTDGCFEAQSVLICAEEESEAHSHAEGCYEIQAVLICTESTEPVHTHTEGCYQLVQQLICSLENTPEHIHTETCQGKRLTCALEEHTHGLLCYSDPTADVESEATWKASLPELTGVYADDVLAIAKSQLGYTESELNYVVAENGELQGYTRYGAWCGAPYDAWGAMFASFCVHYAEVEGMPINTDSAKWVTELQQKDMFRLPSEYIPGSGDLVFFDRDQDGTVDHVGLVEKLEDINATVIEGDSHNKVERNTYDLFDKCIVGYGVLIKVKAPATQTPPETEAPTEAPEQIITPDDTDAWAELVYPTEPAEEPTEESTEEPTEETPAVFNAQTPAKLMASPYSLRRSSTYAVSRAGTPLDLTPYIDAVTMYDENGNVLPSGSTVTEDDLIEFKIEYTITGQQLGVLNGNNVTVNSNTLTYALPKIFQIIQSGQGDIYNAQSVKVGTYLIDSETGTITMTFSDDYVEQNARGIQIHGHVSFFSIVTKVTDSDDEHQDYVFTDDITLGVVIEENNEAKGDLKIEKLATSVNGEEITYQVKVTSTEGTTGSITITDQMSKGLTFVEGISVKRANGTNVSNVRFNAASNGGSFTLTLPEMSPGSSYIVTYKCKADIDLLDADMTVHNTATVTGKDDQGNDLEDETTTDHTFEMLKKTGQENEDGSITWTITINQAKADISGWILEDIITTKTGSSSYTGPVTIRDSNGNVVAQNVRLPYTFPNRSTSTYVITYTTKHSIADGDAITNKAILKDKDTEITEVEGVGIGSPITKEGEMEEVIQDANGTNLLPINWTVTVDTTNGAIAAGEYFYDKMNGEWHTSDMYMTYDQVMAAIQSIEAELKRVGSSIRYVYLEGYVEGPSTGASYGRTYNMDTIREDELYERFTIILGKDVPQGQLLTFTYQTYGIFPNNLVAELDFKNRFNISESYEVEAIVTYSSGVLKATKYAMDYYDPEVDTGDWFWHLTNWTGEETPVRYEYEKLHDSYLAWAIELSIPPGYLNSKDIILYEDLPDGVNVKSLKLPFMSDWPVDCLHLENMEKGQTYTWDIVIYTAQQYISYNHRNGTPISIIVKVTDEGDLEMTLPGELLQLMGDLATACGQKEWYGYLYIFTQIDDDYEWTPRSEGSYVYMDRFENRITVKDEDGKVIDIGSKTQIVTKDESSGAIRKEATTDANNIISYSVVLNAYKKDLIANASMLRVHDELTYQSTTAEPLRLRLVPGSVKLYEIDLRSDGGYTKLGEITANYQYAENSSVSNGTTTWVHTIDLNVPDGKALLLEYSYRATGKQNAAHQVQNTCSVSGVGEGGLDGEHRVELDVKDAAAQADTKGVMIYKVDASNNGIFLEDARFNIYIWNKEQGKYIIVHHPNNGGTDFVTDAKGMIFLDNSTMEAEQFAYNTAYYIVEVDSPNGYYISREPYYFYIAHENTEVYRPNIPDNFQGHALTSGDIIYRNNVSQYTEITIEKYWKDHDGDYVTVLGSQVPSITVELWQMLEGDPSSAKVYGTYTITPDEEGHWSLTITKLPKATAKADGTKDKDYLYYIKEVRAGGYALESSENNSGINSGTIKLVNREQEGYVLPETGGAGTHMYTMAGLLLMLASAAYLVYIFTHRRREAQRSS